MTTHSPTPSQQTTRAQGLLLDVAKIQQRRLELALSLRRLATLIGPQLSATTLLGLENGSNHPDLTLGEVHRLCQVLGLHLADVILDDRDHHAATPAASVPSLPEFLDTHVPRAGAVLIELRRAVPVQMVAHLLDLTLEQARLVLDELANRAPTLGWEVFFVNRDVGARTAPPAETGGDADLLERAWRSYLGRRGLTFTHANLIHSVLTGKKRKSLSNDEQVQVAAMVNAGVLERSKAGGATLSQVASFSLLLDEHRDLPRDEAGANPVRILT